MFFELNSQEDVQGGFLVGPVKKSPYMKAPNLDGCHQKI